MVSAPASFSVGLTFDSLLKDSFEILTAGHINTATLRDVTLFSFVADYYFCRNLSLPARKLE